MSDDIHGVMPLYDRVKHQIYDDYQRLLRQESIVLSAKGRSNYLRAVKHYRIKYSRFVANVFSTDTYVKLSPKFREELEIYRADMDLIKTRRQVTELTMLCSSIVRAMKITKISYDKIDDIM